MIFDDIGDYDQYPYEYVGNDDPEGAVLATIPSIPALAAAGQAGGGGGPPPPGPPGGPGAGGGGTIGYSEFLNPAATIDIGDDQQQQQSNYSEWLRFGSDVSSDVFGYLRTREEARGIKYAAPYRFGAPFRQGGFGRNQRGRRRRGRGRRVPPHAAGASSIAGNPVALVALGLGAALLLRK